MATGYEQQGRSSSPWLAESQADPLHSVALQHDFPGLTAAFDEPAMQAALQAALFSQEHPTALIERCKVDQATYILGESCVIRYLLTIRDRAAGQTQEVLVSGRLFPNQDACAEYTKLRLLPLVELMAGREEIALLEVPVAMVPSLHMAIHAFPIDGELPTLIGATDRARLVPILREALAPTDQQPSHAEDCRVELVDYGRQYRCTLRYHITGQRADSSPQELLVYGKLTGDGTGSLAGPISSALRERVRSLPTGLFFNVPAVLAWRPDLQLSLLEAIPGEPLMADAVKARLRDKPLTLGALSLEEMIDACARIAATLHSSGLELGRRRTLDDELAALRQSITHVQRISPELGTQLGLALERVATQALRSEPLPLCFNHGDFTHGQFLFDQTTSGLVDFDSVCQAEPALDLGQFLTYLRITSLKSKLTPAATRKFIDDVNDRFLHSYTAMIGHRAEDAGQLQARVSVYKSISLLRRALRSWQKFKPERIESALAVLEEEITAD